MGKSFEDLLQEPRSFRVEPKYGLAQEETTSCLSCPAWVGEACSWAGNQAVELWRKGRVRDDSGAVWHFGSWDDTPDKPCPKRGTTPRGGRRG